MPLCHAGCFKLRAPVEQQIQAGAFSELPLPALGRILQKELNCQGTPAPVISPTREENSDHKRQKERRKKSLEKYNTLKLYSENLSGKSWRVYIILQ